MTSADAAMDAAETAGPCTLRSPTAGWYLLTVSRLAARGTGRVGTGDLAERLDTSPASVTEMVGRLAEDAVLEYEKYAGVELTPRGAAIAESLAWRQCVVTSFFDRVLAYDIDDYTAYRIGYTIPEAGVHRLQERIDDPRVDACRRIGEGSDGCLVEAHAEG
ncbi:iron dependent repressor [Natrinema pellirubrum DSM 15624]|uniref:Iron dependent repressor n=1 Tax=Natrinema pellirubrum (strain DSM 15624 / CIP 106293 / JCM 10476 / NCIMB 786 / 157) TaxID=797303 RepID=L0JLP2_NATP1|nr:metal-dependent transcriptional regulator [Natrinema pellirubrum]AGB31497.1 Mn-dependent transcriptional regulator [Natrinema pellirubrum DSM 15624]ELY73826.1 iron dependent repressor [Natrinema pellirubrum DSM 15624]